MKDYIKQYISLYTIIVIAILAIGYTPAYGLPLEHYADSSVLHQGKWHKISITESGIYQISYNKLKEWGFSNPSQVRVYGYGGASLPETYSTSDIDDLPQIPIVHNNNRILFYGQGTVKWSYNTKSASFNQKQNTYATAGYYFITESNSEAITTQPAATQASTSTTQLEYYDDYALHEEELASVSKTGQVFLGEDFRYTQTRNFSFDIPGIDTNTPMKIEIGFGARIMDGTGRISLHHNGTLLSNSSSSWSIKANSDATYEFMKYITPDATTTPQGGKEDFTITYQAGGTTVNARLDYIRLTFKRKLQLYDGCVQFRSKSMKSGESFAIGGMNEGCIIWDITTQHIPQHIDAQVSNGVAVFTPGHLNHEYIAFDPSASFPTPASAGAIANQNLHALEIPDMVILTPTLFLTQARQIAALHESVDSMVVHVIDHELVFNEFSSGTPDGVAYRRFLKMFYDRAQANPTGRQIKHLLLFGRGFYDNRRITSEIKNCGYPTLLTYQSQRSENESYSYTTDDFFTYLNDDTRLVNGSNLMCVSVGRFPVKSIEEANITVEKLYNYVNKPNYGNWRNQAIVVADDGNSGTHMRQAENVISYWKSDKPDLFVNKVYIDAYTAENSSTGRKYPEAKKRMMQLFQEGQLVIDYIGHANAVSWTAEDMLNIKDIKSLYLKNLPFMITATCDFSRFDSENISGGEYLFLNEFGGAIALLSSTRVAWINENGRFNNAISDKLFERNANNRFYTIGEITQQGKNYLTQQYLDEPHRFSPDSNKLVYTILGDPAMRLGYPTHHIEVSTINGVELSDSITLNARSEVTLEGIVLTPDSVFDSNFTGEVYIDLYDAEEVKTSHGYEDDVQVTFHERTNKLFSGRAKVNQGSFSINFKMPKETSFSNKTGMITLYAHSNDGIEASGYNEHIIIGQDIEPTAIDTIGPDITYCYLNTIDFNDGDIINESPMLFAAISDSSGINLSTAGIGHNMMVTIDGNTSYTDVSNYYTPDTTGYSGVISYPINELSDGDHSLVLRVWDNEGNSSSVTLYFTVQAGLAPKIFRVYADNNPARTSTNFYIEHDRPDGIITVTLTVYNIKGMPVWQTQKTGISDTFKTFPITWQLTTGSGARVPGGVYLYRATITTDNTHISTKSQKLLVLPGH